MNSFYSKTVAMLFGLQIVLKLTDSGSIPTDIFVGVCTILLLMGLVEKQDTTIINHYPPREDSNDST